MSKVILKRREVPLKIKLSLGGSKSISNRLLIIHYLSDETVSIRNLGDADDTRRLLASLKQIEICSSSRIPLVIDCGNAGTTFRFLTSYLSLKEGSWLLTGSERMKERPVGILVESLKSLGADIEYAGLAGFPPLKITGANLEGGELSIESSVSSQFISSLMMIAPYLKGGLELKLTGDTVSSSYIRLTAGIMQDCGADVRISDNNIKVNEGSYLPSAHPVEPDWSSASYWYQMAALSDDPEIFLSDFRENSLQGDHFTAQLFNWMGVHTSYSPGGIILTRQKRSTYPDQEIDFSSTPDLVPAYLAACAALGVNARLKGVGHLRFKESDRIDALGKELAKIGAQLKGEDNTIEFIPGQLDLSQEPEFDTYGDHRMAMCMAPLALKFPSVTINDPEVVEKSYPEFWSDLAKTGVFSVEKK